VPSAGCEKRIKNGITIKFKNGNMELDSLAAALMALGCPAEKSGEMAAQLDKRARQLAEQKSRTYEEALTHLISLMRQGWAAQSRGN
jgi:hypothetical protein